MSDEKPEIELNLDPSKLVTAIIYHVAGLLSPDQQSGSAEITFEEVTPPLVVPSGGFWLQFGKRKQFLHEGTSMMVIVPEVLSVQQAFVSALMQSPAFGLHAFNEFLAD